MDFYLRFIPWTSKKRYFDGKMKLDKHDNFFEISETKLKSFYRPLFTQHEKSDYVIFISQEDSQSCFGSKELTVLNVKTSAQESLTKITVETIFEITAYLPVCILEENRSPETEEIENRVSSFLNTHKILLTSIKSGSDRNKLWIGRFHHVGNRKPVGN